MDAPDKSLDDPAAAAALPERTVVLVGLMGAGKSTVGRRLAARLGLPFVDADTEIEEAAGCSIPEIFERYGEAHFRAGERRVIARLLDGPVRVLAAGGGAFMDPETRALIGRRGISVWLRAELDVLVERCGRRDDRPMLYGGDLHERLRQLIELRYPIYAEADIVIDSSEGPHEAVVEVVLRRLEDRRPANGETAR